jgi:hypothetical protein
MLKQHYWVISMDFTYKTNRYSMPLLNIVGFASIGQIFYISFAFMCDEQEETYEVMLICLAEVYNSLDLTYPQTILTDKERALYNAIKTIFPDTNHMICI